MFPSAYYPSPPRQPTLTNSPASSSSTNLMVGIVVISLLIILSIAFFCHGHRLSRFFSRCSSNRLPSAPAINSLVDSLPIFAFSSVKRRSSVTASSSAVAKADCAICLSRFTSCDTLRLLPLCCHAFHSRCIDTWLSSGHRTCPLCRSNVYPSAASILLPPASSSSCNGSFRVEIGSVSRRSNFSTSGGHRSYSIGSFDYVVESEAEVAIADQQQRNVFGGYMDMISATSSSRTASFRSSPSFFTGSSRRSVDASISEWDIEASRVAGEISELFRRAMGV